ncbi:MAG: Sapep family Mn(2+)-dependent dipeptidase [Clostridia bacterium]|nr:Sapep family Mn(2+)-dependent dipeptidase [Clostridia bacterium]MBQ2110169.1 Sapep family Mn(2+)-dependent dipeptidase [Clostridia bacterium]MBQ2191459.1 Sapep family Mn(2+)-dependent dipeptidase [Clostridia bacterium]MBQ5488816.1 Sapep family Mn(2+)-dependent dipeptidase [Clostridia bacterium]
MNDQVELFIDSKKDDIIRSVQESIRFPSVEAEPAGPGAPFGLAVKGALEHALTLGSSFGFKTTNLDGYAGCIDYGEGEEMLGVVCHVDVVPEGEGWNYPPYAAEIADGKIFGRGAMDDKGPAICAIYALAAIKDAGLAMKRRVRIILGTNEETGWGCMNHYKKVAEIPTMSISPDAEYPLVNSEKGIYHSTWRCRAKTGFRIDGGTRANVVCGKAKVFLPLGVGEIGGALQVVFDHGMTVELRPAAGGTEVTIVGLDAHGSMPEHGKNAMLAAFAMLDALPLKGEDKRVAQLLHEKFRFDTHGESIGLDREDSSGRLTLNPGVISWNDEGFELSIDVRHPTSMDYREVRDGIAAALSPLEPELIHEKQQDGHFIAEDTELVSKLLDVFEKRTGKREKPLAIGGGTYARAFPNAVAFGCEKAGISGPVHMPNEFIGIDELMFDTHMLADAIIALACK